jgi:hypothetical protein
LVYFFQLIFFETSQFLFPFWKDFLKRKKVKIAQKLTTFFWFESVEKSFEKVGPSLKIYSFFS